MNLLKSFLFVCVLPCVLFASEVPAFLGVLTRPLASTEPSSLPAGVGLQVVEVIPDSAAAKTLKPGDLLHKFGDQLLVHPQQLAALVGMKEAGETVELTWIREGKSYSENLELGERPPRAALSANPMMPEPMMPFGFPQDSLPEQMQEMQQRMEAMREQMLNDLQFGSVAGPIQQRRSLTRVENGVRMHIEEEDGVATLRIEEGDSLLFEGPVNTAEERAKVPEEYRLRLEQMHQPVQRLKLFPVEEGEEL